MISIVIPIYNRRANLARVLTALTLQSVPRYEVVLADDGSYDDPLSTLSSFEDMFPFSYIFRQHDVPRPARTRNDGAWLATREVLLFLDSDVMLNPTAIGHYINLHTANPTCVICGRYDWLPPQIFAPSDLHTAWEEIIAGRMPEKLTPGGTRGHIGEDPRTWKEGWFDNNTIRREAYALDIYGGNFLIPGQLFWDLGGFDEGMSGHGWEAQEFGIRCQIHHIPVMFTELTIGYHVYHHREPYKEDAWSQENVRYIDKKHDLASLGIRLGGKDEDGLVYM